MRKDISMEQAFPLMEEILNSGGEVSFSPSGSSMMPLLRNKTDTVTLKKVNGKLKKYDVPLYRRTDGTFVIHRIIGQDKNGYIMCGDHQTVKEYGVKEQDILAVMASVKRNGKIIDCNSFGYKLYSRVWTFIRPLRPYIFGIARMLKLRRKNLENK